MKNVEKKNKYNISFKTLKDLRVSEKDYDKVYKIDLKNKIAFYVSVDKKYTFKHTIPTFTSKKQFFSNDGLPQRSRISSIYSREQNQFRTVDIDKFIKSYKLDDKKAVNQ